MLMVMRDPNADRKRRDAMATAAAPYLHPKLSSVEPKSHGDRSRPNCDICSAAKLPLIRSRRRRLQAALVGQLGRAP